MYCSKFEPAELKSAAQTERTCFLNACHFRRHQQIHTAQLSIARGLLAGELAGPKTRATHADFVAMDLRASGPYSAHAGWSLLCSGQQPTLQHWLEL